MNEYFQILRIALIGVTFPIIGGCLATDTKSSAGVVSAEVINQDLALLLHRISEICGTRWDLSFDNKKIILVSKEKVLGKASGSSYPSGEDNYQLYFRFKVVDSITEAESAARKKILDELERFADQVPSDGIKNVIHYYPEGVDQWKLVVQVRAAEDLVDDIPDWYFRSVFLIEEDTMIFFVPNPTNQKAVQYKEDITRIHELMKRAFDPPADAEFAY